MSLSTNVTIDEAGNSKSEPKNHKQTKEIPLFICQGAYNRGKCNKDSSKKFHSYFKFGNKITNWCPECYKIRLFNATNVNDNSEEGITKHLETYSDVIKSNKWMMRIHFTKINKSESNKSFSSTKYYDSDSDEDDEDDKDTSSFESKGFEDYPLLSIFKNSDYSTENKNELVESNKMSFYEDYKNCPKSLRDITSGETYIWNTKYEVVPRIIRHDFDLGN